ncbi:Cytochrome p450 protein [Lasiodiplodia theobromae]|uniref:Cytochrome p450 protein n=1 Tax=Lasiodiplodia theobromae TaxID=45133 RepID=UPI0015C3E40C|nr:Cytochrome p450 protein [Lasiodiplodia theobromae]KAF4543485.1 Cytochrome p450 protein [Lasiodiplodia theobromae]
MEGYKKDIETPFKNQSDPGNLYFDLQTTSFYYGRFMVAQGEAHKATYEYETQRHYLGGSTFTAIEHYSIGQTIPKNGSIDLDASDFDPVDGLRRIDADVSLIFLSANAIMFTGEVNDPLYSAHQPLPGMRTPGTGNETITLYTLNQGIQAKLPDNQWQLDVEHWHDISMASLQSGVVNAATGPSDPSILEVWQSPQNAEEHKVCHNTPLSQPSILRVRQHTNPICSLRALTVLTDRKPSATHTNFSVFGLAFVFVTGTILILLSWFLEPCVAYIQKRGGWAWFCSCRCCFCCRKSHQRPSTSFSTNAYARLEWSANETLQLQRLAHEELGVGPWEACDSAVPVTTRKGERLGVLDLEDWTHPRLKAPPRDLEDECIVVVASVGGGEEEGKGEDGRGDSRAETREQVVAGEQHEGSGGSSTMVAEMRPDGA